MFLVIKIALLKELQGVDVLHKFNWIRLISRMFEAMAGMYEFTMYFTNAICSVFKKEGVKVKGYCTAKNGF